MRIGGTDLTTGRRWSTISLVLALLASISLLILPSYGTSQCTGAIDYAGPHGETRCLGQVEHQTLVEVNGPHVLWLLAAPVAICSLALVARRRGARIAAGVLLFALVLLGAFSIGGLYLPSAAAMVIAATRRKRAVVESGG